MKTIIQFLIICVYIYPSDIIREEKDRFTFIPKTYEIKYRKDNKYLSIVPLSDIKKQLLKLGIEYSEKSDKIEYAFINYKSAASHDIIIYIYLDSPSSRDCGYRYIIYSKDKRIVFNFGGGPFCELYSIDLDGDGDSELIAYYDFTSNFEANENIDVYDYTGNDSKCIISEKVLREYPQAKLNDEYYKTLTFQSYKDKTIAMLFTRYSNENIKINNIFEQYLYNYKNKILQKKIIRNAAEQAAGAVK